MDIIGLLLIVLFATFVVYKLGIFGSIEELAAVATRESTAYNREHKVRVAKRYESLSENFDPEKINDHIAKVDKLNFD